MQVLRGVHAAEGGAHLDQEQGGAGVPRVLAPLHHPHLAHARHRKLPGGRKNGQCHFTSMTKLPNTTDLANYHIILGPGHGPRQPEVQHERGPALDQGLLPLDHQPLLLGAAAGPRPPLRRHRPPPHRRGPGTPRTIVSKISPVYGCTL